MSSFKRRLERNIIGQEAAQVLDFVEAHKKRTPPEAAEFSTFGVKTNLGVMAQPFTVNEETGEKVDFPCIFPSAIEAIDAAVEAIREHKDLQWADVCALEPHAIVRCERKPDGSVRVGEAPAPSKIEVVRSL